jgi:hypothetical protein
MQTSSLQVNEEISVLLVLISWNEKVLIPEHKKNVSKKNILKINNRPLFMAAKVILI